MKKFFTLIAVAIMAMGVNAQGTYGVKNGDAGVAAGSQLTSVRNITMTWGVSGGEPFKDAKGDNTLEEALGATGYCEGNGENGGFSKGTVYYFEPTEAGKLTVGIVLNANKAFFVKDASENDIAFTCTDAKGESITFSADGKVETKLTGGLVTFSVEAGQKYAVYCSGSKLGFYGFKYEAGSQEPGGAEVWSATDLNLDTDITSRENTSAGLKKVPTQYPGDRPDTDDQIKADATGTLTLTDYIFTAQTANVTLTGVSTPNSDQDQNEAWRFQGPENQYLNLDACPVKFTQFIQSKTGNPSMEAFEYFFTNSDGATVGPRYVDTYWEPGCGQLPAKGEYYEMTFKTAGTFLAGVFIQRPTSNLYVLDKETIQLLAPSAITINGYNNNNTVDVAGTGEPYMTLKLNDDYTIAHANSEIELQAKPVFGFISFSVEAGKTYLMFNPKNQLGLYGFQFTEGDNTNGVETITANKVWNADAPMYNLAGQKVDKSYKGIVIQNGRKFYNK